MKGRGIGRGSAWEEKGEEGVYVQSYNHLK